MLIRKTCIISKNLNILAERAGRGERMDIKGPSGEIWLPGETR